MYVHRKLAVRYVYAQVYLYTCVYIYIHLKIRILYILYRGTYVLGVARIITCSRFWLLKRKATRGT